MTVQIESWPEPERILLAKLQKDMGYRKSEIEPEWDLAERLLEDDGFGSANLQEDQAVVHPENSGGDANSEIRPSINYPFKHYRLLHSQMSANPPTVGARPLSSDEVDRDASDAAEDTMRFWHRHANLQEVTDNSTGKTLKYGTGWVKTIFDPNLGPMVDFDEEKEIATMEGDASVYSPSTWDVWIDSSAMRPEDVEHQWERTWGSYEYWATMFSEPWQKAIFKRLLQEQIDTTRASGRVNPEGWLPLYFYYEKGMPRNAMRGRFSIITEDGQMVLEHMMPNPHFYRPAKSKEEREEYIMALNQVSELPKGSPIAKLPLNMLTDIDVDDRVYGRSFLVYEANGQDIINRLDMVTLDNIKAHGSSKVVVTGGGKLQTASLNDDQFQALLVDNPGQVYHLNRPGSMPDIGFLRTALQQGGDDAAGVNDAMFGKVDRETSGSAMQTAASQGNQVRRRLFNKYVNFVEGIYRSLMMISREHWDEGRTIEVLGQQGKFKRRFIKALDIDGGYEYFSTYGEQFSLDPALRRQEIMQLIPTLQEAGVIKPRQITELLKLNEIEAVHDMSELGKIRQKNIFEQIKKTGKQVPIDAELEDHDSMLEWARYYWMSEEILLVDELSKKLIREHIMMRSEAVAKQAPSAPPGGPEAPQQALPGPGIPQIG